MSVPVRDRGAARNTSLVEFMKVLTLKILRNEVDHFEVIYEGNKFGVDFSESTEFVVKKRLLLNNFKDAS